MDIRTVADEQGLTDDDLLDLALQYISNQQQDDAFINFLQENEQEDIFTAYRKSR